jgi:DNA-binding MarR family transcriptional regulator
MPKNVTARTLAVASKIIEFIADNPNTHIRAIARELNLHPQTVKRCVDRISEFLEFTSFKNFDGYVANLPILIRLKNGYKTEEILSSLKNKKGKKSFDKRKVMVVRKNTSNSTQSVSPCKLKIDKKAQILRIVKFLEENPNSYLREIARTLNLNPAIVHRCLKEINDFIITEPVIKSSIDSLPNLPIMIRLKEGVTVDGILRFLQIRERIDRLKRG